MEDRANRFRGWRARSHAFLWLIGWVLIFGFLAPHNEATPATDALEVSGGEITYNGSPMEFLRDRCLEILEALRQFLLHHSKWVRGSEAEVRQVLMTVGIVARTISQERATRENHRLQGQVARLTKVLVALTIVLVALSGITIWATIQRG